MRTKFFECHSIQVRSSWPLHILSNFCLMPLTVSIYNNDYGCFMFEHTVALSSLYSLHIYLQMGNHKDKHSWLEVYCYMSAANILHVNATAWLFFFYPRILVTSNIFFSHNAEKAFINAYKNVFFGALTIFRTSYVFAHYISCQRVK